MRQSELSGTFVNRVASYCLLLTGGILLTGCGGGSTTTTTTAKVATVTVAPTTSSIRVGAQQTYAASPVDAGGSPVSALTITWASSAPTVASVSDSGLATALSAGTTQITATADGVSSAPATLTVTPTIVSVSISPTSATIAVNSKQQFTATAFDSSGNAISGTIFTWSNSFGGVATIDSNGLATGIAPGTVLIVASAGGVTSPVATLTVTP